MQLKTQKRKKVLVVGGGAAGIFAAARAAERGAEVTLLEKNPELGRKILISGKGRANLTNVKPLDEFIEMYGPNGRFLSRAFRVFFREELIQLLGRYGLAVKTERGGRVFPATDDAADVIRVLRRYLVDQGVGILLNTPVLDLTIIDGQIRGVQTPGAFLPAHAVILATGGVSYPATGSTGDGHRWLEKAGHRIVPLRPALVPLIVEEVETAASMQGVTLKNVRLTSFACRAQDIDVSLVPEEDIGRAIKGRKPPPGVIESRRGEMMLTHFGLGGPVTMLMSLAVVDKLAFGPVSVNLDLKPALDFSTLDRRLQRDLAAFGKRSFKGILAGLVPRKMVEPLAKLANIPLTKPAHQINATERTNLVRLLKSLRFNIRAPLPISHAVVTAGGVALAEIDPRTMASRLVRGLYLCGELLDIDADTGGYNLQAAFSTGYLAGEAAARPDEAVVPGAVGKERGKGLSDQTGGGNIPHGKQSRAGADHKRDAVD